MNIKNICVYSVLAYAIVGDASAAPVTVHLTGHITGVYDDGGVLGGQLAMGQSVTGLYTYESSVPDQNPDAMYGEYPQGSWQGAISISAGSLVFETDSAASNWFYNISVHPSYYPGSYESFFTLSSSGNKVLANGATVDNLRIAFEDFSGHTPSSEYLPSGAPNVQQYTNKRVELDGSSPLGSHYGVVIAIDSASISASDGGADSGLVLSPASGKFLRMQHFDAALILPQGSPGVQSVQASINGMTLPFNFGYSCYFAWNMQNVPAVFCPNASWYIPDGANHVDWRVELMDGTVLNKAVDWELIP